MKLYSNSILNYVHRIGIDTLIEYRRTMVQMNEAFHNSYAAGKANGETKAALRIAKCLKHVNIDLVTVAAATGLSLDETGRI